MDTDGDDDFLTGFMYEIKFYNIARSHDNFNAETSDTCFFNDCDTCCTICPTDQQCLKECEFN